MQEKCEHAEECWVSLLLRLAVASMFAAVAIAKWQTGWAGLEGVAASFRERFQNTWLPLPLVAVYVWLLPFAEALIPVWLVTGVKLRWGWIFTVLVLISLGFGMMVARQYETAAHNFGYVLIACWGLYFSKYDRISLDALKARQSS